MNGLVLDKANCPFAGSIRSMAWAITSSLNGVTKWHGPDTREHDEAAATIGSQVRARGNSVGRIGERMTA